MFQNRPVINIGKCFCIWKGEKIETVFEREVYLCQLSFEHLILILCLFSVHIGSVALYICISAFFLTYTKSH